MDIPMLYCCRNLFWVDTICYTDLVWNCMVRKASRDTPRTPRPAVILALHLEDFCKNVIFVSIVWRVLPFPFTVLGL